MAGKLLCSETLEPFDEPIDLGTHKVALLSPYCLVTTANEVKCWGSNDRGQLGTGTAAIRFDPAKVQGVTGLESLQLAGGSACGVTTKGPLQCWGADYGDAVAKLPAADAVVVDLGLGDDGASGCAVLESGRVWCWKADKSGKVSGKQVEGVADAVAVAVRSAVPKTKLTPAVPAQSCAATKAGEVWCWSDGPPKKLRGLEGVTQLEARRGQTCALAPGRGVYCWGWMSTIEADHYDTRRVVQERPQRVPSTRRTVEVSVGERGTCRRDSDGKVTCWPRTKWRHRKRYVKRAAGLPDATAVGVAERVCAGDRTGAVRCWHRSRVLDQAPETSHTLAGPVRDVVMDLPSEPHDRDRACAVVGVAGDVWCWGDFRDTPLLRDGHIPKADKPRLVRGVTSATAP